MTSKHPVELSFDFIESWASEYFGVGEASVSPFEQYMARKGAEWGADRELDACCKWLDGKLGAIDPADLRSARRPKPKTLIEQVNKAIDDEYEESLGTGFGEARAAVLAVAAWLREQGTPATGWAIRLEQEARSKDEN